MYTRVTDQRPVNGSRPRGIEHLFTAMCMATETKFISLNSAYYIYIYDSGCAPVSRPFSIQKSNNRIYNALALWPFKAFDALLNSGEAISHTIRVTPISLSPNWNETEWTKILRRWQKAASIWRTRTNLYFRLQNKQQNFFAALYFYEHVWTFFRVPVDSSLSWITTKEPSREIARPLVYADVTLYICYVVNRSAGLFVSIDNGTPGWNIHRNIYILIFHVHLFHLRYSNSRWNNWKRAISGHAQPQGGLRPWISWLTKLHRVVSISRVFMGSLPRVQESESYWQFFFLWATKSPFRIWNWRFFQKREIPFSRVSFHWQIVQITNFRSRSSRWVEIYWYLRIYSVKSLQIVDRSLTIFYSSLLINIRDVWQTSYP